MSTTAAETREPLYRGLRMTADEYYQLEDDGFRYELIDGVVCMSPSPTPTHQEVSLFIGSTILNYLRANPVGRVFIELDVHLGAGPLGGDLVYRPDLVFIRGQCAQMRARITETPDLIVEVVSASSRRMDYETKKNDYERVGVGEYWIVDSERAQITCYRRAGDRFIEVKPDADQLGSAAIPGFVFDLADLRKFLGR